MKQTKSLVVNSKISFEAVLSDGKQELFIKLGNKDFRIADTEINDLHTWLGSEVLGVRTNVTTASSRPVTAVLDSKYLPKPAQEVVHFTVPQPAVPSTFVPLEDRRAVSSTAPKVYPDSPIRVGDNIKIEQISGSAAIEAFKQAPTE